MTKPVRLLLVEDSAVYRETLAFLLGREEDLVVVGTASDGGSAVRACEELRPDAVVVDWRLPDLTGDEVAAELRRRVPEVAIVFLSASAAKPEYDPAHGVAAPFVRKDEGTAAVVDAVRAVTRGTET